MTGGESFHQDTDLGDFGSRWYFSRKEIEESSPSRKDGIDLKKEIYLRKSYCTFLQDLGIRLKVPQVTIATAIVLCHRFFLRQSHAKNDRRTIATVCMFLAGKAEETPRPLKDVILVSCEIMHKKDPSAVQRIKQKEVCDQQKELIQIAERVVLSTLGFDLNVHHPYKPLVEAIKKFKVAQNALAQVAWNFVNDGLRTSLCLQFKPHLIAAGAIFLAAKFLKVKLPSDGEKFWWQEFDVTPRQLEDVSNQMLELYEQNRPVQASHANEVEGSTSGGPNQTVVMSSTINENPPSTNVRSHASEALNAKQGVRVPQPARLSVPPTSSDFQTLPQSSSLTQSHENASTDTRSEVFDRKTDNEDEACLHNEVGQNMAGSSIHASSVTDRHARETVTSQAGEAIETRERKDDAPASKSHGYPDSVSKLDRNKFKAALERRRKQGSDVSTETNLMDEDDLIEREIENGIELAVEDEKLKQEKRTGWPKSLNYAGPNNQNVNPEDGELSSLKSFNGSERAPSKWQHDLPHQSRDAGGRTWIENTGRDHKRPRHDGHA